MEALPFFKTFFWEMVEVLDRLGWYCSMFGEVFGGFLLVWFCFKLGFAFRNGGDLGCLFGVLSSKNGGFLEGFAKDGIPGLGCHVF